VATDFDVQKFTRLNGLSENEKSFR